MNVADSIEVFANNTILTYLTYLATFNFSLEEIIVYGTYQFSVI